MSQSLSSRVTFGPFCLTSSERRITKDGVPVEIGGRSLDLLIALVDEPGRVVSKQELQKRVWANVIVEDSSLRFHMANLRKVLRDGEDGARYISTQVGVGYAFVAQVRRVPIADSGSSQASFVREPKGQHEETDMAFANLPARSPRVIGRERDIQLLVERVAQTQLFTIVGPAGVGKTTLAVEIGHVSCAHFGGKRSFVDLGRLQDPALVPSAIAGALGIPVQADDPMTVVLGHIRARELLLILDNCEHVISAVASIVERVRDTAPKVSILATSREPLRVRGEHVHWLRPLDYPSETAGLSLDQLLAYPAVELFIERASAGNSALEIDAEAARMIADMCRRLDGMALPIELAAVRVAGHGLRATSRLLGERFSLAWTGPRTAVPRQQTLQATLDWSFDLLSEVERRTLERLSVFLGPFTLGAASYVVTDGIIDAEAAAAALDNLTNKSLISSDLSADEGSYRLLEMTRAYARRKLLERGGGEANATARRHATFYREDLEALIVQQRNFNREEAYFSQMLGNIRSALEWSFSEHGDVTLAVPLAAASARVFLTLSLLVECRTWCARGTAHLGTRYLGTSVELELQAALGLSLMFTRGNGEAVEIALRRALDVATSLGDRWNELRLLGRLHIFHERIGDFTTALVWARTAVEVAATMGDPEAIAVAASLAGVSLHLSGDQTSARRELELSLERSLPSERGRTIHYGFDHRNRSGIALARTLWLQGYADQARRVAGKTVAEASALKHPVTHCIALIWSLSVHLWAGDVETAQANLDAFANFADVNAFGPYIAASCGFRGELTIERGQTEGAVGWIELSLAQLHGAKYELLTSSFEIALAKGLMANARHEEALAVVASAIRRCIENGELYTMPELLRVKACAVRFIGGSGPHEAETWLLESLACSRSQGARAWELRAALDLARLWAELQRPVEALQLLKPLRDAFSEGFDTADMRAADQLLQELTASNAR